MVGAATAAAVTSATVTAATAAVVTAATVTAATAAAVTAATVTAATAAVVTAVAITAAAEAAEVVAATKNADSAGLRAAERVENHHNIVRDFLCRAAFNTMTWNHGFYLPIHKKGECR